MLFSILEVSKDNLVEEKREDGCCFQYWHWISVIISGMLFFFFLRFGSAYCSSLMADAMCLINLLPLHLPQNTHSQTNLPTNMDGHTFQPMLLMLHAVATL